MSKVYVVTKTTWDADKTSVEIIDAIDCTEPTFRIYFEEWEVE